MNLHRTYIQLTRDIIPGISNKLFGGRPQPKGLEQPASEEWAITVPLQYEVPEQAVRVAVVCHLYHSELIAPILLSLVGTQLKADLFLSTDTEDKANVIRNASKAWIGGNVTVCIVENRGRDIGPKLTVFQTVYGNYDLLLFLHTKKSEHSEYGERWREYLMACLAGSNAVVRSILEIFRLHADVGVIAPQNFSGLRNAWPVDWGTNFRRGRRLGWKMDFDVGERGIIDFPSGSMFWARPAALKPVLSLGLKMSDFPAEPLSQSDSTLAHHIERLFFFACERAGFKWVKIVHTDWVNQDQPHASISAPIEIERFISQRNVRLLDNQPN